MKGEKVFSSCGSLSWCLLFFSFFFGGAFAIRPQLVNQQLWFMNQTVLNEEFRMAVVQMEFDQDLYLSGENFLCGRSEEDCPTTDCIPCDWSSQQPSGCDNIQCCGPAQAGGEAFEQVNDWCDKSPGTPPYYSLNLNERSPVITQEAKETAYFRFFIPEEVRCKPFQILIRPFYGVPVFFLSNLFAFPTSDNASWRKGKIPPNLGWAQNSFVVCPNAHIDYQLGTYSLAVFSWYSSSYYVEIVVSPQEYPLQPPPGRILCADVPESEIIGAQAGSRQPTFCLQDTESFPLTFDRDSAGRYAQFVLPIPSGCHEISFASVGTEHAVDTDVFCAPRRLRTRVSFSNNLIGRTTLGDDRLSFSMCSDNVSYVRCAVRFIVPGPTSIIFSTVSIPYRTPLTPTVNTPSTGISSQEGLAAFSSAIYGDTGRACTDFYTSCRDWIVPPSSDPLIFWPPPAEIPKFDTENTNVYAEYFNATSAQPLEKTLTAVIVLAVGTQRYYSPSELDEVSLSLLFVTNELGETPQLPNDAPDLNAEQTQASPNLYLSTISLASFPELDLADLCNETRYQALQNVVDTELTTILNTDSLDTIQFHKYVLDIFNAGIAGTSCTLAVIEAMDTSIENVTLVEQTFCQYERDTLEWDEDPCCNRDLRVSECCVPFTIVQEEEEYTTADSSTCGVPECAETYYEDLAQSLNHVNDIIQGCSSGIEDIKYEFAVVTDKQLEKVVRNCLHQVGLGENFEGIDCVADFECEQWSGRCNHQNKKCMLGGTTSQVEDAYLQCYISKMSSSLEEYLRVNVLPPEAASQPRDSEGFFLGLKSVARVDDCIAIDDPLDIFLRSRYVWTASDACKANILGLSEDDVESANALCPPGYCLGTSCRQSTAQCYRACEPRYIFHPSSELECSLSSTICPVTGLPGECEGSYCVYCPGGEDEEGCQYVAGDQDFCENTVACELLDGSVVFGLTEGECDSQTGSCSVDCPGESCRSLDGVYGVCLATVSSESLCNSFNSFSGVDAVWYEDTICVISTQSSSSCSELSLMISVPTTWETCESLPTTSCDGSDAYQRYLKCFVDIWHTCPSQEECERSGHCDDRPWTTMVQSAEHPIEVQFASCFIAGRNTDADLGGASCFISTDRPGIGCRDPSRGRRGCRDTRNERMVWLTPAMNEAECIAKSDARYGCQLPETERNLIWLFDEACECRGGISKYAWKWTDGVWRNGVSRTLKWREIQPVQKYEWAPSLSFELLQTWLEKNEEQRFAFAVKSEVICQNGFVTSPLNSLICDCISSPNDDEGTQEDDSQQCYHQQTKGDQVEELVGLSGACTQEESFLKGPSSRVSFSLHSVKSGCTLVNLSIVSEAWFAVPPTRPSISFEFEDKPQRGIVFNKKGATVGVLRGDESVFSFSVLENVAFFSVCLLVSDNETDLSEYPIPDFGYSTESIGNIYPLGIADLNSSIVFSSLFWCGTVTVTNVPRGRGGEGNTIRLFPIQRIENYQSEEEDYTSQKTRALMYTLGVCYCICFFLLCFYLGQSVCNSRSKSEMLALISFLFIILCVFRAVFMFGYPNGLFDGNELAEFVVFEIPTFLLFSVVITSIFFWKKLASKKKFFGGETTILRGVIALGLVFVWSLWVIVTIVYSEVILEDNGESPCPGRVAPSYDKQEEDTRTLTIIYQSLIISVTFVLAAIFCFYSYSLIKISKRVSRSKRFVMVIGGTIVLSFFLRCILFIIILAVEFVSSIYMFITLMITEVFLLFFLQLQFNFAYVRSLLGGSSTGSTMKSAMSSSGTRQSGLGMDD